MPIFIEKLASQNFKTQKNNCDHYGTKVKNKGIFKTFFGFSFLDILKMSKFHFPFYFLEKMCYHNLYIYFILNILSRYMVTKYLY